MANCSLVRKGLLRPRPQSVIESWPILLKDKWCFSSGSLRPAQLGSEPPSSNAFSPPPTAERGPAFLLFTKLKHPHIRKWFWPNLIYSVQIYFIFSAPRGRGIFWKLSGQSDGFLQISWTFSRVSFRPSYFEIRNKNIHFQTKNTGMILTPLLLQRDRTVLEPAAEKIKICKIFGKCFNFFLKMKFRLESTNQCIYWVHLMNWDEHYYSSASDTAPKHWHPLRS